MSTKLNYHYDDLQDAIKEKNKHFTELFFVEIIITVL